MHCHCVAHIMRNLGRSELHKPLNFLQEIFPSNYSRQKVIRNFQKLGTTKNDRTSMFIVGLTFPQLLFSHFLVFSLLQDSVPRCQPTDDLWLFSLYLRVLLLTTTMSGNAKLMTCKQSYFASCCYGESVKSVTSAHRMVTHIPLAGSRRVADGKRRNKREKKLPSLLL